MTDMDILKGRRASYTGKLNIGEVSVPISLYNAVEAYGIQTHLYHEGCGDRITQPHICPSHPDLITKSAGGEDDDLLVTYAGLEIGDSIVAISNEEKADLLESKADFEFISSHKMTLLPTLMNEASFVPIGTYRAMPPRAQSSTNGAVGSALLVLLERMRLNRRFIVCTVGLGSGVKRYVAILPSGVVLKLAYTNELLPFPELGKSKDTRFVKFFNQKLVENIGFPEVEMDGIEASVAGWFVRKVKSIKASSKKTATKSKVRV